MMSVDGPPDLTSFSAVRKMVNIDTGISLHTMMKVSHIHLFGIGLLLLSVGMIFRHTRLRTWLKITLILLPFIAILVDILAWFFTRWDPVYAYTVVVAGGLLGLGLGGQVLIALYQLWLPVRRD
jgi:glucan phosphoethanolaminetransferase (alkaline phosphatase superfamily)